MPLPSTLSTKVGDGFTFGEANEVRHHTLQSWEPREQYKNTQISKLVPGSGRVCLLGRVVNLYEPPPPNNMPSTAKGCFKLHVRDDSGTLMVRLWFAEVDYLFRLGQLVSVWTTQTTRISHVDFAEGNHFTAQTISSATTIFPERDKSCYIMVEESLTEEKIFREPIGYRSDEQLPGLVTLKHFVDGGHESPNVKVLVCVKSVGARKRFTTKQGFSLERVDVNVFDDTFGAMLSLCGRAAKSAAYFKTSHTILLLSNPAFRSEKRPLLCVNSSTHVDVDPCMTDTEWLRRFAQSLTTKEAVNIPFPERVFDGQAATCVDYRALFTVARMDEYVRDDPAVEFMGYLSVIVLEMNITSMHQRNRMFCAECCGVPVYANKTSAKCKQCGSAVALGINPRLVGTLIDESGTISSGKLVFSSRALRQLLGKTPQELSQAKSDHLRSIETRILFLRLTLQFGWSEKVGRLCVCQVLHS